MKTKTVIIGSSIIVFESETYAGEIMDTQVTINGVYLCVIAGSDIDNFINEFKGIVNKYRI